MRAAICAAISSCVAGAFDFGRRCTTGQSHDEVTICYEKSYLLLLWTWQLPETVLRRRK